MICCYFERTGEASQVHFNHRFDRYIEQVKDIHSVFWLLRCYVREFDSDEAKISNVVPKNIAVGLELKTVPLTAFFTSQREEEVVSKFMRRQNGLLVASLKVRRTSSSLTCYRTQMKNHTDFSR